MKAILEFDMDEHEDIEKHKRMLKASDLCYLIHEFENEVLRDSKLTKEQIIERFYEIKNMLHINIDEIWS